MVNAITGGVLIGLAAVWFMASLGRIAGISGIAATAFRAPFPTWALLFLVGLLLGGGAVGYLMGVPVVRSWTEVSPLVALGGLVVGAGTRLGSGCTSGHGVGGIARLSVRSITATAVFLTVGIVTATMVHG